VPLETASGGGLAREVKSGLGWVGAGMVAGLVGWVFRRMPDPAAAGDEEDAEDTSAPGRVEKPSLSPLWGSAPRVFAVVVFSAACLVGVVVTPPSVAGWAVLLLALFGLMMAWVLAGQDSRVRRLEQRVGVV